MEKFKDLNFLVGFGGLVTAIVGGSYLFKQQENILTKVDSNTRRMDSLESKVKEMERKQISES